MIYISAAAKYVSLSQLIHNLRDSALRNYLIQSFEYIYLCQN